MVSKPEKILYTMGEVSEMFDVNQSLIRFWEQRFDILKPKKNKKGNRLFTREDIKNLEVIYHLVKERGMTLAGAEKYLKANKEGASRDAEIVKRLQEIRSVLVDIKNELKEENLSPQTIVIPSRAEEDETHVVPDSLPVIELGVVLPQESVLEEEKEEPVVLVGESESQEDIVPESVEENIIEEDEIFAVSESEPLFEDNELPVEIEEEHAEEALTAYTFDQPEEISVPEDVSPEENESFVEGGSESTQAEEIFEPAEDEADPVYWDGEQASEEELLSKDEEPELEQEKEEISLPFIAQELFPEESYGSDKQEEPKDKPDVFQQSLF